MGRVGIKHPGFTRKQEVFCMEYAEHWDGHRAALTAGYSKKTAAQMSCELLLKPKIQAKIQEIRENVEESTGLSKIMVVNEHKKIAFSSISHMHNDWVELSEFEKLTDAQKQTIKKIETKVKKIPRLNVETFKIETVEVEFVKIELYDKQKSLDSISKLMGYVSDKKAGHNPADPPPERVTGFTIKAPDGD